MFMWLERGCVFRHRTADAAPFIRNSADRQSRRRILLGDSEAAERDQVPS